MGRRGLVCLVLLAIDVNKGARNSHFFLFVLLFVLIYIFKSNVINGRLIVLSFRRLTPRPLPSVRSDDKSGQQLSVNRVFFDERWSQHRTVTSLDWSPQFPELLAAR